MNSSSPVKIYSLHNHKPFKEKALDAIRCVERPRHTPYIVHSAFGGFWMQCPFCTHPETKVTETRETNEEVTRRRRECLRCEKRFTTYERVELNLTVIKKSGTRVAFDRNKVKNGLVKACEKRPISQERIEQAVDEIETKLRNKGKSEVSSHDIGEEVMKSLKKLDQVAYVRFASVYREFADLTSFQNELKNLMVKKNVKNTKSTKKRRNRP